jgi:SNF2 family DNA or RNA helicase
VTCYKLTVCLFFCSNVIQKTKKLAQFKEENVKVLLMSLGNSAAGTNLIEANYVVLVDPMQGSVEEARAYEMQALGRAHRQGQDQNVHLVRFVVRDSVEEELYTRNKSSGRSKSHIRSVSFFGIQTTSQYIILTNLFICSQK